MIAALIITDFFACAGILLPFGYGQGTGQAMNYGQIYEIDNGFVGGKSFGLTIAALGFLCASIGGVIHLNILKRKGKIKIVEKQADGLNHERVEDANEIPMQGSVDKFTVQLALVAVAYVLAYALMAVLGLILPGMKSTIFGFNFLLGVLSAIGVKSLINFGRKKNVIKKQYVNNFLMTRISNFFFDLMVVSGIAAIQLGLLENYWGIIAILGVVGMVITYLYNRIIANKLFKDYPEEQFVAMYGMLTGTASTGIILLRELDKNFETPVADNLVYQNLPAIAFGFPIMLLATFAPTNPGLTLGILIAFFAVMNVILFRKQIFKRKGATTNEQKIEESTEQTETAE
jgi:ESS family glutamate:Na+ symporter